MGIFNNDKKIVKDKDNCSIKNTIQIPENINLTHTHNYNNPGIEEKFIKITEKLDKIMANIDELTAQVDALQVSLDDEQAAIAAAIAGLQVSITDLTALVADGGTADQRQALSDKLAAITADLQGTV